MTKKELIYLMVANDAELTIKMAERSVNSFMECVNKVISL